MLTLDKHEKHYDYYLERQCQYLCDYDNFIHIDDSNDKDKIFLSGLVYLTQFNDKFTEKVWCPCSPWNRNWLYHFCPFHEEIPICKSVENRGPIIFLEDMHVHADKMKVEYRWRYLINEFMDKVFFHEDDFLPSKKPDDNE